LKGTEPDKELHVTAMTVFPVIGGETGTQLIYAGAADFDLDLVESRTLDGRTLVLLHRPTRHA
jgi:hypothetical protein